MSTTTAALTEGQTFTITEAGHRFEGRTLVVKAIGATGRTRLAIDEGKGNKVFLTRSTVAVTVAA